MPQGKCTNFRPKSFIIAKRCGAIASMVSIKDLLEPYALRRRTQTGYYVGLLTITTALLIFSIILDYAGSYLATPLIQLGSMAFFATILLGVAERSAVQSRTRRNVLFTVLDALGNTSYSVLPFFVASGSGRATFTTSDLSQESGLKMANAYFSVLGIW